MIPSYNYGIVYNDTATSANETKKENVHCSPEGERDRLC